jgi:hypothetical protein
MLSKRIHNLFLISVILFIAHGLEEYFAGFYNVDNIFQFAFQFAQNMSEPQAIFLLFQIMLWILLIFCYLLIFKRDWILFLLTIPALILIIEVHHLIKAAIFGGYYPGSITAAFSLIIGFFYWKELIKLYKAKNG